MSLSFVGTRQGLEHRLESRARSILLWATRWPIWAVALLMATSVGLNDIVHNPGTINNLLGDSDDATRLIEVRQLLAGQSWFDMTLTRFGGAEHPVSHWSRLIDLPLAGMIIILQPLIGFANAEIATRLIWPTLLSAVLLTIIGRYCASVFSASAGLLGVILAGLCAGHVQFVPGRIDHHNGMIVAALGGIFLLIASLDRPRLGWLAGFFLGIGCSIGLEGLILTVAALGIVTVTIVATNTDLGNIARAACAFSATLLGCHVLFGPYSPGGAVMCDQLSMNLVALAIMASIGVCISLLAQQHASPRWQLAAYMGVCGALGLGLYATLEPACLRGPYGQLDAALSPIWLDTVLETRSAGLLFKTSWVLGFDTTIYLTLGLAWMGVMLVAGRPSRGGILFAITGVAFLLGLWQIRLLPYALFLAVPVIVFGVMTLLQPGSEHAVSVGWAQSSLRQRFIGILSFACFIAVCIAVSWSNPGKAVGEGVTAPLASVSGQAVSCASQEAMAPLRDVSPGLAINEIDLGPYIVAFTDLDVLAAPYHRLGRTILATHEFHFSPLREAEARMRQLGATYIILCPGAVVTHPIKPVPTDALRTSLLSGVVPDFLEPINLGASPLKAWRLKTK